MCERCDEIREIIQASVDDTECKEARVLLTSIVGAIVQNYGPVLATDMMADAVGFFDYQIGLREHDDDAHNGRHEMRRLFDALLHEYSRTASQLLAEDRATTEDGKISIDTRLVDHKEGTVH